MQICTIAYTTIAYTTMQICSFVYTTKIQWHSTLYLMCTMLIDTTLKEVYMRRKRNNNKQQQIRHQRDINTITKISDLLRPFRKKKEHIPDDRRYFRPIKDTVLRMDGNPVEYKAADSRYPSSGNKRSRYTGRISYQDPGRVTVCRRRKARRQSLFAAGKVGAGKRVTSRRRFTDNSEISCKG